MVTWAAESTTASTGIPPTRTGIVTDESDCNIHTSTTGPGLPGESEVSAAGFFAQDFRGAGTGLKSTAPVFSAGSSDVTCLGLTSVSPVVAATSTCRPPSWVGCRPSAPTPWGLKLSSFRDEGTHVRSDCVLRN